MMRTPVMRTLSICRSICSCTVIGRLTALHSKRRPVLVMKHSRSTISRIWTPDSPSAFDRQPPIATRRIACPKESPSVPECCTPRVSSNHRQSGTAASMHWCKTISTMLQKGANVMPDDCGESDDVWRPGASRTKSVHWHEASRGEKLTSPIERVGMSLRLD